MKKFLKRVKPSKDESQQTKRSRTLFSLFSSMTRRKSSGDQPSRAMSAYSLQIIEEGDVDHMTLPLQALPWRTGVGDPSTSTVVSSVMGKPPGRLAAQRISCPDDVLVQRSIEFDAHPVEAVSCTGSCGQVIQSCVTERSLESQAPRGGGLLDVEVVPVPKDIGQPHSVMDNITEERFTDRINVERHSSCEDLQRLCQQSHIFSSQSDTLENISQCVLPAAESNLPLSSPSLALLVSESHVSSPEQISHNKAQDENMSPKVNATSPKRTTSEEIIKDSLNKDPFYEDDVFHALPEDTRLQNTAQLVTVIADPKHEYQPTQSQPQKTVNINEPTDSPVCNDPEGISPRTLRMLPLKCALRSNNITVRRKSRKTESVGLSVSTRADDPDPAAEEYSSMNSLAFQQLRQIAESRVTYATISNSQIPSKRCTFDFTSKRELETDPEILRDFTDDVAVESCRFHAGSSEVPGHEEVSTQRGNYILDVDIDKLSASNVTMSQVSRDETKRLEEANDKPERIQKSDICVDSSVQSYHQTAAKTSSNFVGDVLNKIVFPDETLPNRDVQIPSDISVFQNEPLPNRDIPSDISAGRQRLERLLSLELKHCENVIKEMTNLENCDCEKLNLQGETCEQILPKGVLYDVKIKRWDKMFEHLGLRVVPIDPLPNVSREANKRCRHRQEVEYLLNVLKNDIWGSNEPLRHPCGADFVTFTAEDVVNSNLFQHVTFAKIASAEGQTLTDPDLVDDVVHEILDDPEWPVLTVVVFLVSRRGLHGVGLKRALKMARERQDWRYVTVVCRGLNVLYGGPVLDDELLDILGLQEKTLLDRTERTAAFRFFVDQIQSASLRQAVLDLVIKTLVVLSKENPAYAPTSPDHRLYIAALETMEDFEHRSLELDIFFLKNLTVVIPLSGPQGGQPLEVAENMSNVIDYVLEHKHLAHIRNYLVNTNAFRGHRSKINVVAKQAAEEGNWPLFLRCLRYGELNVQQVVHGEPLLHLAVRQPAFQLLRLNLQNLYGDKALDDLKSKRGWTLLQEAVELWARTGGQLAVDNALLLLEEGSDASLPYYPSGSSKSSVLHRVLSLANKKERCEQAVQLLRRYLRPGDFWRGLSAVQAEVTTNVEQLWLLDVVILLPEHVNVEEKLAVLTLLLKDVNILRQHRELVQARWLRQGQQPEVLPLLYLVSICTARPQYLQVVRALHKSNAFLEEERELAVQMVTKLSARPSFRSSWTNRELANFIKRIASPPDTDKPVSDWLDIKHQEDEQSVKGRS